VDAVQDKLVVESVVPEAIKLVGTVGAWNQLTGSRLVEHIPMVNIRVSIILSSINVVTCNFSCINRVLSIPG
jgi:hypothetical protein